MSPDGDVLLPSTHRATLGTLSVACPLCLFQQWELVEVNLELWVRYCSRVLVGEPAISRLLDSLPVVWLIHITG